MIRFLPYIGASYNSGGIFSRRIMVLGDSHYCADPAEEVPSLTRDVINYYLDPSSANEGWMQTYRKFERSLVNRETTPDDSIRIWNSLLFYNFLQVPLSGPRVAGTTAEYRDACQPFFEVIDTYQPEVIIVWGKRLWDKMPTERWTSSADVVYDNYAIQNGYYSMAGGSRAKTFYVYHPSAGYSWDWWYNAIMKVIG